MKKFLTRPAIGFALLFFDELLFNILDSIDWQSFKVIDLLKKEWQRGKQNQKKACRVKNSLKFLQTFSIKKKTIIMSVNTGGEPLKFENLPEELISNVLKYLSWRELLLVSLVSKEFRRLTLDNYLWKNWVSVNYAFVLDKHSRSHKLIENNEQISWKNVFK